MRMFNPLNWWNGEKAQLYPILWRLAEVYFAIPAASASSERAFSGAGNIITARRCRLNPGTVQQLHFLRENIWILRDEGLLYNGTGPPST
jgi:hypothetical protein